MGEGRSTHLKLQRPGLQKVVHIKDTGQHSTQHTLHPPSRRQTWHHHHRPRHRPNCAMGSTVCQRPPQQLSLGQSWAELVTKETDHRQRKAPDDNLAGAFPVWRVFQHSHSRCEEEFRLASFLVFLFSFFVRLRKQVSMQTGWSVKSF